MNRVELKTAAKEQIRGKIGILFLITLIIGLITSVLNVIPTIGSIASALITPVLSLSLISIYLNLIKGVTPAVNDIFSNIGEFWSAFKVYFLVGLFTSLWSLLFVIPGIIKGISYSMAPYILAENPGKPALECINESKAMTEGHKMELFVLSLSFIGWALLCGVTFGIAYIWVGPYMQATMANAYNSLKPAAPVVEAEAAE